MRARATKPVARVRPSRRRRGWSFTATVPGAPLNLAGTAGDAQVTLVWDAPTSDGGTPITDYVVQYRLVP
jgi:hypothetical protein